MATKITIEIDGPQAATVSASGTGGQSPCGGMTSQATGGGNMGTAGGLQDLYAQAAAIGAINAGPAPSSLDSSSQAPIAASVGGHVPDASEAASAGAAPHDVFGQPRQTGGTY